MAAEDLAGQHVGDHRAGWPGRIAASWLSLKLASTHRPRAGTSESSCAPTVA